MQELVLIFNVIDKLFDSCNIDYTELVNSQISTNFFDNYDNQRVINSFLFNFAKIQDKIGSKLFRKILLELKEIDNEAVPMKDMLNLLEKLKIINSTNDWDKLRELRNLLAHEYPFSIQERIENIHLALDGYDILKNIYINIKRFCLKEHGYEIIDSCRV